MADANRVNMGYIAMHIYIYIWCIMWLTRFFESLNYPTTITNQPTSSPHILSFSDITYTHLQVMPTCHLSVSFNRLI